MKIKISKIIAFKNIYVSLNDNNYTTVIQIDSDASPFSKTP